MMLKTGTAAAGPAIKNAKATAGSDTMLRKLER
jgi:hypothetical protein